jgi:nitrogenase molybdenum-cofactor synthesis protein NifE
MNTQPSCLEIPRVTCALFGAIKAVATLKRTVVLVHGPRGCVYHINYILGMRGDRHNPVFSTCMDEHDVIFGAGDRLRNAIEDLDRHKKPDMIVVLSCCASGIIGEDLESACRAAQTNAQVIPIEAGGFSGDFSAGYAATLRTLVSRTAKRGVEKEKGTVNLVGMLRGGPDLREIKHLLSLIGLSVMTVLPAGSTVADLQNVGRAERNIVICETSGLDAAKFLGTTFGTPWITVPFPVGAELSLEFLHDVSESLGLPPPDSRMIPREKHAFVGRKPTIALCAGPTRAIALARFLRFHGLPPRAIVLDFPSPLLTRIREAAGPECEILVAPGWERIEETFTSLEIDLVIGGLMERSIATRLGISLIDIMHGSQKTAGVEGGENILSLINKNSKV